MTYIETYCNDYLEKIFYFCLKKTGNEQDAEELASNVSYEILASLHRGTRPRVFNAWVWSIAKNQYAKWAKERYFSPEADSVDLTDVQDVLQSGDNPERDVILSEDMSLLRRELAFIRSDYRNILIAHYFEEKSVSVIAKEFHLPLGTVKTKLQNSRKRLKEGMNMAREFGKRSYNPEEINFSNSCSAFGDKGQPWSVLEHSLYKNIFLEVYDNPSTAEDLSLELGIALPYMEDELKYLTEQTFLTKKGNKYETAFPIISKQAQENIMNACVERSKLITALLEKLIDRYSELCGKYGLNFYGGYQSYEDAKWTLLMLTFDCLLNDSVPRKRFVFTKRPDNGAWDIVGYQQTDIKDPTFVGCHSVIDNIKHNEPISFEQYKFGYKDINKKTPAFISTYEALTLELIAKKKQDECDPALVESLLEYGYIKKTDSGYEPTIVVFGKNDAIESFSDTEKAEVRAIAADIINIFKAMDKYTVDVITEDLPQYIRENERMVEFAIRSQSFFSRSYVFDQAISDGWLKYDENTSPVIGANISIG